MDRIYRVKKTAVALIIFILAFCLSSCFENNLKNDFEYVYTLEAKTEGKQTRIGTCFYAQGAFYTNAHLIVYKELGEYVPCESVIAKDEINNCEYELEIIDYDLSNDYAKLKTACDLGDGLRICENYVTTIGEDIFTIGNLNNNGLAYGYGRITSKEKTFENLSTNITYIQTNIEISNGNSGGPVFNSKNEVIGIMSLKLVDKSNQYVDGASFFVLI